MKPVKVTYPARQKPPIQKLPKFVQIPDSLLNPVRILSRILGPRLDPDSALCQSGSGCFFLTLSLGPVWSPAWRSKAGFSANPVPDPEPDTRPPLDPASVLC
jgi:hypothetical protein